MPPGTSRSQLNSPFSTREIAGQRHEEAVRHRVDDRRAFLHCVDVVADGLARRLHGQRLEPVGQPTHRRNRSRHNLFELRRAAEDDTALLGLIHVQRPPGRSPEPDSCVITGTLYRSSLVCTEFTVATLDGYVSSCPQALERLECVRFWCHYT